MIEDTTQETISEYFVVCVENITHRGPVPTGYLMRSGQLDGRYNFTSRFSSASTFETIQEAIIATAGFTVGIGTKSLTVKKVTVTAQAINAFDSDDHTAIKMGAIQKLTPLEVKALKLEGAHAEHLLRLPSPETIDEIYF